uniref:Uncharacterized protein n=1 Tax=viral metagenome TaxID=1070528 RepID=A0A6M3LLM0_9ZZZZ
MERFNGLDGKPSPNYYWEVSGTVFIFLPSREEAESLIPDMEYLGYYKCDVDKATNSEVGLRPVRYLLRCSWCQGEELE